ncbi:MAG: hypothetical protein EA376_13310 [Phycisphaeraceae bacterium]|nr:MAG: hypothetical protein EA376_13310 [Phycisphaeraceae bacterium]
MGLGIFDRVERNTRRDEEKLYPELALFPTDESRDHARRFARYRFATTRKGRFIELSLLFLFSAGSLFGLYVFIGIMYRFGLTDQFVLMSGAGFVALTLSFGWRYINRSTVRRRLRLLLISEGIPVCPSCGYDLAGVSPELCPECGAYPLKEAEQVGLKIPERLRLSCEHREAHRPVNGELTE